MASVTEKPQASPVAASQAAGLVDQQIHRTRRALKGVDLAAGMIMLVIGALSFLLTMAMLEHWVIPGGWGSTGRAITFSLLIAGVAWYSWRIFWPLLRQPINPAYAALAIEQSSPSLKNSLLNLLLLRGHRQQMPQQVYHAIEQQAAQQLAGVPIDSAVDRSAILRLGYILVAVVALGTLYRILSPKDPFTSAARVLMPWSDITFPSRVQILDVSPGNTSIARGEPLQISAELLGLEDDEPAQLLYSTIDEQKVNQEIRMMAAAGSNRFECALPSRMAAGEVSGVQQDLTYWIEAGDARSPRYQVSVFARPTLVVSMLRYEYPAYTGYPSLEVQHTGDIRAIEGSRVTLMAQSNKPIRQAHVDFEADGKHDLLMKSDDQKATVTFPLELKDDRRTPRYESYVLRYQTNQGRKNQLPPKYQIDVIPDYAPEVQLLLPEEALSDVKLDQQVAFEVEARDPDFAVSDVTLFGEVAGEQVVKENLLSRNHQGRFLGKLRKTPAELGLHVGDVMEYWAAAIDNRRPTANVAHTVRRKLRVVDSEQGNSGEQQGDSSQGENGDQQPEAGALPPGDGQEGDPPQDPNGERQDAESGENDGTGEGGVGQQGAPSEQAGAGGKGQENEDHAEEDLAPDSPAGEGGNSREASEPSVDPSDDSNGGENPGGQSGENQGQQQKVSAEGDDDGTAFERITEHFDEQAGSPEGAAPSEETKGDEANPTEANPAENSAGEAEGGENSDDQSAGSGENPEEPGTDEPSAGEANKPNGEAPGAEGLPEQQLDSGDGQGAQPSSDPAEGGQMSPEQGPAGAGENPGEEQGVPQSEGAKKPRDKPPGKGDEGKQNDQEPSAAAEGQTESDSKGGQGGDRSGGGQEGAGQQADAEGTGGAGENTAAEDGGGQATEPGEGDAGALPGDQQQAEGQTGESSKDQPGDGSEPGDVDDGRSGDQPDGAPNPAQNGADPKAGQPAGDSPPPGAEGQSDGKPGEGSQPPQGGGEGGNAASPPEGELLPADKANLEYARNQTDLVLDKLEDQLKKKQVDEGLLDSLGWNQDELRRFVDRWKNLKSQAEGENGSKEARAQLDDSLRSLGLLPTGRYGYRSHTAKDRLRDLQDAYRGRTPLEYQEQVRAYIKGTATSEDVNDE